jgi:parallel beta-helix repeat protein
MSYRWLPAMAVLCLAGPAGAATYTVSSTGSDSANGVTAPFRTLQKAVSVLRDGDTILIEEGTYPAGAWIERRNITIRGEGAVVLDGASTTRDDGLTFYQTGGITLENLTIRNCRRMGVFCVLSDGLTVRNCTFTGNAGSGLLTGNTHNVLVDGCVSSGNTGHGIYLSQSGDRLTVRHCTLAANQRAGLQINAVEDSRGSTNPSTDSISEECVVEGNTVLENGALGGSAIQLMSVRRSLIANNLVYGNLSGGISLWDDGAGTAYGCKENRIVHNTVAFERGRGRYGLQITRGSTGNQVFNNVLVCGNGPALEAAEPVQSNHNCFWAPRSVNSGSLSAWQRASGNDLNSLEADPGLLADFRPADGSPARDGGIQMLDTDKDGGLRPQGPNPDVGCYEADAAPGPPPPPAPQPQPEPAVQLYGDNLHPGWSARGDRVTYSLNASQPVLEGSAAIQITGRRTQGYLQIGGTGITTTGKNALSLWIYGDPVALKALRLRALVGGGLTKATLSLSKFAVSSASGWTEYRVPLGQLQVKSGSLTGVRFITAKGTRTLYVDDVRLE